MTPTGNVEIGSVKAMSVAERLEAKERVAMKSARHLRDWMRATGRTWVLFHSEDLIKALWPHGVETFMQVVALYREHRGRITTGRTETMTEPTLGKEIEVPVMKTEQLELNEIDSAIRFLVAKARMKDSSWSLDNPPLSCL